MTTTTNTQTVPTDLAGLTGLDYAALSGPDKARARANGQAAIMAAVADGDLTGGQALVAAMKGWGPTSTAPAPVDHRQTVADRIATLRSAADILEMGLTVPTGVTVSGDWTDLPTGTPDTEQAVRIAEVKVTRSTDRHDIKAAVDAWFADQPAGTFATFARIATESGLPSSGAVAAHAKSDRLSSGLTYVPAATDQKGGIRKG